jgi:general secretion pathway protein D
MIKIKQIILTLLVLQSSSLVYAVNNKQVTAESQITRLGKMRPKKSSLVKKNASSIKEGNALLSKPIESHIDSGNIPLSSDKVVLNFENSDIQTTIKAISQLSGKNFVVDPRVKGSVTIVSDQPINKVDSYKVLETALRMQGFAVIEGDGVIKVLPEADAKTYGMKTVTDNNVNKQIGDQVITKIFIIQRGSAMQLANSLRPLVAQNNSISAYPNSNALIVTDYASNISRISKIITQLSATAETKMQPSIITLKYSVASDVAQILQSYLQNGSISGGGGGGNSDSPTASITVDPTTNSLIIYSTVQSQVEDLKALALNLDKNIGNVNNDLHVVYLRNADAAHIADVLRVVASGQENPDLSPSSAGAKFATEPTSMFQTSGGGGGSSFGGSGSSNKSSSPTSRPNTNQSNAKDAPKILIQAEPTTNALIIQAPDSIYRNLRMIIDMLDVRRAQVMIEAMIAEINSTTAGTFGIQWLVGGGNSQLGALGVANYGGSTNGGPSSALSSVATTAAGIAGAASGAGGAAGGAAAAAGIPNEVFVGLVTGTVSIGGQTIPGIGTLADMIASNSNVNILSRPTLITLDNEEARILVGQNIGIPNGSYINTASANTVTNTITRQDVGTFLNVKPMITQSGSIQLDVYQEDSQVDSSSQVANSTNGPSINTRRVRSTMLVDDGQIIAIGGMVRENINIQKNGIPGLSDIPYLGWLFSWQSRVHVKQNLVLFLRPVIIRNADGAAALTNRRYKYIMDQENMIQAKGNLLLPEIDAVNLENQIPYNNANLPPQPNNQVINLPIIDMRGSTLHNSGNANAIVPMQPQSRANTIVPMQPQSRANTIVPMQPQSKANTIVPMQPQSRANTIVPMQPQSKANVNITIDNQSNAEEEASNVIIPKTYIDEKNGSN